ncbi:MAG: hypothetical protein ACYSW4_04225 [Planctomycetota bacterium]
MSDFTNVNLESVKLLYIGFGDRDSSTHSDLYGIRKLGSAATWQLLS